MSDIPPDLAKAAEVDPTLIDRTRANAQRLVGGVPKDFRPEEEPAHVYLADVNP